MQSSVTKKVQILSYMLMILYYIVMCCSLGFFMAYLVQKGVTPGVIGILTSVYSAGAAILQPILGRISDSSPFFDWKKQLFVISGIGIVTAGLMLVVRNPALTAALFVFFSIGVQCMGPLIFASPFYYGRHGIEVNFGKIRAFGSLSYAVFSYLIGISLSAAGHQIIPLSCMIFSAMLAAIVWMLPRMEEAPAALKDVKTKEERAEALRTAIERQKQIREHLFYKKYPKFILVLVSVFFIMFTFSMINTFMLQITQRAGGGSEMLGIANAVGAAFEIPMIFFFSKLLKKFPVTLLVVVGAIGFTLRALFYYLFPTIPAVLCTTAMACISYAIMAPAIVYLTDLMVDKEDSVTGQAMMSAAQMISAIVSNFLFGLLFDRFGLSPVLIASAIFSGIGAILALVAHRICNLGVSPE